MYAECSCFECGRSRDLNADPSVCPYCGTEDFFTDMSAVDNLIESRTEGLDCKECNANLSEERIEMYPHDNGWKMSGVAGKWWMSIRCPQCGYESSFAKFGITRN